MQSGMSTISATDETKMEKSAMKWTETDIAVPVQKVFRGFKINASSPEFVGEIRFREFAKLVI